MYASKLQKSTETFTLLDNDDNQQKVSSSPLH